jgi:cytochrome c oxidase cbb3-type subunit I/II
MWKEFTAEGTLAYGNFLDTVTQILPMYALRAFGGTLYLIGALVMVYNLVKTVGSGQLEANEMAQAPTVVEHAPDGHWHRWIEQRPIQMLVGSLVMILIGGLVEMIPTFLVNSNVPKISTVEPYTPLELQGRDIYIKEGCYVCHSQMIRPFRSETERYGEYSKAGEFIYDRPFQWGSKRTGPDLHRVGGKYPHSWHYNHMIDPTSMSPGSIMPPYPWLAEKDLDVSSTAKKIRVLQTLGTPYPNGYDKIANDDLQKQAEEVSKTLKEQGIEIAPQKEMIALIAYLQRLGTDIKKTPVVKE